MRKKILCFTGLAGLILGIIMFAANGGGHGYGPHHPMSVSSLRLTAVLVVGGLILFVRNLDHED